MYDETQIGARLAGLFGLAGKVAVITGSAQGLGRETARLMAEAGAKVVIADLRADAARDAAAAIESGGGTAMSCQVDVADAGSVKTLYAAVDRQFGGVDILVNNAADRS